MVKPDLAKLLYRGELIARQIVLLTNIDRLEAGRLGSEYAAGDRLSVILKADQSRLKTAPTIKIEAFSITT
jgi:hypothetical protein